MALAGFGGIEKEGVTAQYHFKSGCGFKLGDCRAVTCHIMRMRSQSGGSLFHRLF
jgi:hypothetical protein